MLARVLRWGPDAEGGGEQEEVRGGQPGDASRGQGAAVALPATSSSGLRRKNQGIGVAWELYLKIQQKNHIACTREITDLCNKMKNKSLRGFGWLSLWLRHRRNIWCNHIAQVIHIQWYNMVQPVISANWPCGQWLTLWCFDGSVLAFTITNFLAVAPNFPIMVVGRFLYGIGIGLAMHAAPMYIAETAPSQKRGMFISLKEFFIVLGMLLGYIAGNLYVEVVSGWRYMYATSTPLCLIMGVGMCWLPASPRWLLLCAIQGKGNLLEIKENATRCLCRLRPASPDLVSEQVNLFLDELSYVDQEKETCFSEIFRGKCLKAMIIACGLVFFQQVTGQPSVLYYAATILQSAGFSRASDATRVSILLVLLKLILTGAAVLVVDRLGRRPLLIGGVSGILQAQQLPVPVQPFYYCYHSSSIPST